MYPSSGLMFAGKPRRRLSDAIGRAGSTERPQRLGLANLPAGRLVTTRRTLEEHSPLFELEELVVSS